LLTVSVVELNRLREAFRKVCQGSCISVDVFAKEVFGDYVPRAVAEVSVDRSKVI